jgi:hypothetical protein
MNKKIEQQLHRVNAVLDEAFFAPLYCHDWLGFYFNQPFLLGLAPDELKDLFIRCALADGLLHPDRRLPPLAGLLETEDPAPLLAQALASLKDERPFLFHRVLCQLPALQEGGLDPADFPDLESLLEESLAPGLRLGPDCKREIKNLRARAASALEPADTGKIKQAAARLLKSPALADIQNDSQLRLWLSRGSGSQEVEPALLPQVLLEVWAAWAGAITGAKPDREIILACCPDLRLDLTNCLPPKPGRPLELTAACPYCQESNLVKISEKKINTHRRCPHLVFIGSSDPLHLLRALLLAGAEIGEDALALLDSYYNSPSDHGMFATFICDLYQRLLNQERIKENELSKTSSGQPWASLRA